MLTVHPGVLPRPVSSCMTLNPLAPLALSLLQAPHTFPHSFSRCWPSDTSSSLLKSHLSVGPPLSYSMTSGPHACPHTPLLSTFSALCFYKALILTLPQTQPPVALPLPVLPTPQLKYQLLYGGTLTPVFMASYPTLRKVPGTGEELK